MQILIGEAAPECTWDENWATVRSNGGFPVTEDGRSTNPITDSSSSEQLELTRNPMEIGHDDGGDRSRAYIVDVVDHPYLATWLPLWLTMPSYTSTTPVVLA
ncbi:hypothetical protein GW17_00057897, partial [Ensete ventricosum]